MKFSTALSALALLAATANAQTVVDVATSTGTHKTLVDLVGQAELADTLNGDGPWTLFGPTDGAFAALPESILKYTEPIWHAHLKDILLYHVVPSKMMSEDLDVVEPFTTANGGEASITSLGPPPVINGVANITTADVEASNGVVHVIDAVLAPSSITKDIVDVATSPTASDFTTLVDAVVAAGLDEALKGDGPFTVFAPTNDAFAALDKDTLEFLLSPEGKEDLTNILTYHVFPYVVYASDIAAGNITMLNKETATISVEPSPMINGAKIVGEQILASNGVIHAIDSVILPPSMPAPGSASGSAPGSAPAPAPLPMPQNPSGAATLGTMVALALAATALLLA